MNPKHLLNFIELAYSPISNYEFSYLKKDKNLQQKLDNSSLYIISQRPELSFENVQDLENGQGIKFDLQQVNNKTVLHCKLSYYQPKLTKDQSKVFMEFGSNDETNKFAAKVLNNIHGINLFKDKISPENFLISISPEKFLFSYLREFLNAEIEGDISRLLIYHVLYVGKSTEQNVLERLTGHTALQDIVSQQYPLQLGSLPTHEIAILFLRFYDNLQIDKVEDLSDLDSIIDIFLEESELPERRVFLDAEKALINMMQPNYNKERFKSYPRSRDGLYGLNYKTISYSFTDPITLIYDDGEIEGRSSDNDFDGDSIIVTQNQEVKIIKGRTSNHLD